MPKAPPRTAVRASRAGIEAPALVVDEDPRVRLLPQRLEALLVVVRSQQQLHELLGDLPAELRAQFDALAQQLEG